VDPSDLVYRGIGSRLLSRVDPERIDMRQSYAGQSTILTICLEPRSKVAGVWNWHFWNWPTTIT
jgi:hypothetical protein